jgi:hypothetical protein
MHSTRLRPIMPGVLLFSFPLNPKEGKAMAQDEPSRIERIKLHIVENKKVYIAGAAGLTIGLGIGLYFRRPIIVENILAPVFNNKPVIAPVMNNSSAVNLGGHLTKLVKCLETGEMWETVTEAAKGAGVSLAKMSRHLNGAKEHVDGLHYAIVGIGTTG